MERSKELALQYEFIMRLIHESATYGLVEVQSTAKLYPEIIIWLANNGFDIQYLNKLNLLVSWQNANEKQKGTITSKEKMFDINDANLLTDILVSTPYFLNATKARKIAANKQCVIAVKNIRFAKQKNEPVVHLDFPMYTETAEKFAKLKIYIIVISSSSSTKIILEKKGGYYMF